MNLLLILSWNNLRELTFDLLFRFVVKLIEYFMVFVVGLIVGGAILITILDNDIQDDGVIGYTYEQCIELKEFPAIPD